MAKYDRLYRGLGHFDPAGYRTLKLIEQAHARNIHKLINIPTCSPLNRYGKYAF